MVIVAIFLGWRISWQFTLLEGLYLFAVILISNQDKYLSINVKWLAGRILQGLLLYAVVYVGLNQYGFNNLIRIHILLFSSLSTLIIITSLYISNIRDYYLLNEDDMENLTQPIKIILLLIGLLLLAYGGFFITTYHWRYAGYFALAVLPAILLSINLIRKIQSMKAETLPVTLYWLNTILALGLIVFFIYFFLDSTQVIQAILGGY